MIDPEAATAQLQAQFEFFDDFVSRVASEGVTLKAGKAKPLAEAVAAATLDMAAPTFSAPLGQRQPTHGQEAQSLADWHSWLRVECSARYKELQSGELLDVTGLDKTSLNRNPDLMVLNGIRMGIGRAARRAQKRAQENDAPAAMAS